MAYQVVLAGAQLVRTSIGSSGGVLADLGYTGNGVQVTVQPYTKDVPSDDMGGDAGIPTDIQDLGEIHVVRCEFTKYDPAQALLLEGRLQGSSSGAAKVPGTLIFGGSPKKSFILVLATSLGVAIRTYTRATVARQPQDVNKGTIFSRYVVTFECFPDPTNAGKVFNEA